ncbi:transcription elongation factor SPT6-like isoform X2 [Leptopilina boulardi]|uniref:transcription elongation factor SPT6-like isoform X2 n=1 Tax=Leptopilina boulardi TaxID=63433 RepID=UPI0021F5E112|nr:transcription elongation factor SPT6-like isoform X2 [Leptopilina boulardi]
MADFIHSEAEESEDEEELDYHDKKKLKRLKAMEESEEEEEDEERMREELKDLIDDGPIEEDGDDSDNSERSKKRKRSDDDFDDRLEDDDYDLIEENLGVKVERKRFKRVQKIVDEESEEEAEQEEERDAIANELFEGSGDEDDGRSERSHRVAESRIDEVSEGDSSDADDFIVDDEGRPIREKRKKKHIFADSALQEAQDIFGVDFDYEEFEKYGDEDEEEEEEDEYEEEGDIDRQRRSKKQPKKKTTRKSIFEIYEPSELRRGHFTDQDNEVRMNDIPERMQIRSVPVVPVPEGSDELDHEAKWIYEQAFCKPTFSVQDSHLNDEAKERARERANNGPQTIGKIKKALDFMRNQHFEVPFISFYRKEYVLPELNINDLWKVYKFDAKWCQLRQRKEDLLKLFENMKNFQLEEIMKNPDAPLSDGIRIIKDDDVERLKNAQTPEEINDIYRHFKLYYSEDIQLMQESVRLKERETRKQEKLERRKQLIAEAEENGEDPPPEEDLDEDENEVDDVIKKPVRNDPYSICKKAGLHSLSKRFGLTPEHFAENLRDNYQRHEVDQEDADPLTVAIEYCGQKFSTPEETIKAAQLMVAIQLAREPLVRKTIRDMYMERAKLSVRPTKKGIKEIDENHPVYSMKYLKDKPIRDFVGDQFLKLVIAEQDKLITMSFSDSFEGNTSNNYIDEVKQLYYRDEFSKTVQEWNALRVASVEMALTKMVVPDLKKELKATLLAEAKECVMRSCCRKMYNWLKIAPYTCEFPEEEDEEWDTSKGLRVMGIAYVPDESEAPFACIVAPDGECTDFLKIPHILKRKNSPRESEKIMKEADLLAIRNFIATKKPHLIVIGGETRDSQMIQADIRDTVLTLVDEEQFPNVQVEICDNEFSKVYANSNKGITDFRDYSLQLRQAISLARRMQDPLLEFSQLCTSDNEILCLKYHQLQDQFAPEDLLENIYLEFVNRVNEVGVDINKAVQQAYFSNIVQFVCGLGSRKGQALLKILKQTNQRLENRTQLVTVCHMGPKVFINCAGFIKIDTNSLGDSTEAYVEVLDGSRVHPETYEWARKMAVDALEYDDEDANPAGALEEILEAPERLKDLDLDAFAEELDRQGFGNKSITLYDIRAELNSRYKDLRATYQSPNPETLFDMLTKETMETFHTGKLVLAKVVGITHKKPQGEQLDQANPVRNDETGLWQCPFCLKNDFPELSEVWNHFDAGSCPGKATGIRLRLDNGVSGYIHIKNLSDKHVANPKERVAINQPIHCRITKIEVEKFSVECTSKSSDLADRNHEFKPQKDPFYDNDAEEKDIQDEIDSKKAKQKQIYIKRVIVHPSFHNVNFMEAEKLMKDMKQGDAMIRPSSKGADHLTITWKVIDNVHQHIDVKEEGKANDFSLGSRLWIGSEEFEDLDEIIARHVNPMASYVSEVLDFKYYKSGIDGMKDKAEEIIKAQKKANPSGIPYILSAAKNYPGKFLLSYLPRAQCRHEYVSITPEGFKFRGQMFGKLCDTLKWFKEHFRDPIPGQATPSTPRGMMSSRTPYITTPAPMNGYTHPMLNSVPSPMTGQNTPMLMPFRTPYLPTTPGPMNTMTQEVIQRVAQNMPHHMLNSLSQVASQTYQPHTPATTFDGMQPMTPYTPSDQTQFNGMANRNHKFATPQDRNQRFNNRTPQNDPPEVDDNPFSVGSSRESSRERDSTNRSFNKGGRNNRSNFHSNTNDFSSPSADDNPFSVGTTGGNNNSFNNRGGRGRNQGSYNSKRDNYNSNSRQDGPADDDNPFSTGSSNNRSRKNDSMDRDNDNRSFNRGRGRNRGSNFHSNFDSRSRRDSSATPDNDNPFSVGSSNDRGKNDNESGDSENNPFSSDKRSFNRDGGRGGRGRGGRGGNRGSNFHSNFDSRSRRDSAPPADDDNPFSVGSSNDRSRNDDSMDTESNSFSSDNRSFNRDGGRGGRGRGNRGSSFHSNFDSRSRRDSAPPADDDNPFSVGSSNDRSRNDDSMDTENSSFSSEKRSFNRGGGRGGRGGNRGSNFHSNFDSRSRRDSAPPPDDDNPFSVGSSNDRSRNDESMDTENSSFSSEKRSFNRDGGRGGRGRGNRGSNFHSNFDSRSRRDSAPPPDDDNPFSVGSSNDRSRNDDSMDTGNSSFSSEKRSFNRGGGRGGNRGSKFHSNFDSRSRNAPPPNDDNPFSVGSSNDRSRNDDSMDTGNSSFSSEKRSFNRGGGRGGNRGSGFHSNKGQFNSNSRFGNSSSQVDDNPFSIGSTNDTTRYDDNPTADSNNPFSSNSATKSPRDMEISGDQTPLYDES